MLWQENGVRCELVVRLCHVRGGPFVTVLM
jgi:hypothetical protein